jgi:hypothetical protein
MIICLVPQSESSFWKPAGKKLFQYFNGMHVSGFVLNGVAAGL